MPITRDMFNAQQAGVNQIINQGGENQRSAQEALLKQYLQGREPEIAGKKQTAQNKSNLETLLSPELQSIVHKGGMVKVGDITSGIDPAIALQRGEVRGEESARKMAIANYNKALPKLQGQFQAANEGLSFTNDPKNIGSVGQAKTLMLKAMGMNRFNEDEAKAVLPPTMHQAVSSFFNSSGEDNNPMGANQKAMVNQFFQNQIHSVKQQHDMLKQGSVDTYDTSRYAIPGGHQAVSHLGTGFGQSLDAAEKQYAQVPATKGPDLSSQPPAPNLLQQAIAAGKHGLGAIFGGGAPAPATMRVKHRATGQTGTIPANEFDPNQYDQVQ